MDSKQPKRPYLVLVPGGKDALGPISRAGLFHSLTHPSSESPAPLWTVILFWSTKALLIASMAYFLFA